MTDRDSSETVRDKHPGSVDSLHERSTLLFNYIRPTAESPQPLPKNIPMGIQIDHSPKIATR